MDYNRWIEEHSRSRHLTIADVLAMQNGESAHFVLFCRNICDFVTETNSPQSAVLPADFFRAAYHMQYTKKGPDGSLDGSASFYARGSDFVPGAHGPPVTMFTFDIEYAPDQWYPLDAEGNLPSTDPQGIATFNFGSPKSFKSFPLATRLGGRGPAMKLEDLLADTVAVAWTMPESQRCDLQIGG